LTGHGSPPSKTQQWFCNLSQNLDASFRSSALIEHNVTKGESRESQILDVLQSLLPTRISVGRNVVIVDSTDVESPKFDGVLFDRTLWPLLFHEDETVVAMLESVLAAIEVKSSLGTTDLKDIFAKAAKLRHMTPGGSTAVVCPPLVTGFAYECKNTNLAFFDFAAQSCASPEVSPTLVCILNRALLGLAREEGGLLLPVDTPYRGHIPVMYSAGTDTLLMYLYFLSRWATMGSKTVDTFRRYSESVFAGSTAFQFDDDFLRTVTSDGVARVKARQCFQGYPQMSVKEAYSTARTKIGLPALSTGG